MITVKKLDPPVHDGNWHDKPFRWTVHGPGNELQNFTTKALATIYARIRRNAATEREAFNLFIRGE